MPDVPLKTFCQIMKLKQPTERFRASQCLDVFDVRHSEEVAVLSFVITNSLISFEPFFMMVMLKRFSFFLRLTMLRDNY